MKKILLISVLSVVSVFCCFGQSIDDVAETFKTPDKTYYPWVYWYWMNNNINEKGLLADLESMDEVGIGTAMAFDVGIGVPGSVQVRSEEWYRLMKKVILKADQLGMRLGFHCPGWANSGGPWITPETSMKELTWSETVVEKGTKKINLPAAPGRLDYYKDIAIYAFPSLEGDDFVTTKQNCVITDTLGHVVNGYEKLLDNDRDTWTELPGFFDVILDEAQDVRNIQIRATHINDSRFFNAHIWYYDEVAKSYVKLAHMEGVASGLNDRPGMGTSVFAPVHAKKFRIGMMIGYGNNSNFSPRAWLQEVNLQGSAKLPCWHNKTGFGHSAFNDYDVAYTPQDIIDPATVVDLTDKMDDKGNISWKVPEGKWTIVRLGYIPTGSNVQPLPRGLRALESDKYSAEVAEIQYHNVIDPLYELVGEEVADRVFVNYHIDSYEAGWQNWSSCLPEEFQNRRGYSMKDYMLTLTGRIVKSVEETNAFLWDWRRTMADCYADNHIGHIAEMCRERGMQFSIEAYDGPFEDLQTAGRTDMPMSEIWQKSDPNSKPRYAAMYAAHVYDRKLVGTEQFTGMGMWDLHPWLMKNNVDASLAYGVNNICMHVYSQQPWTKPEMTPGATLGPWGAHYDRGNTWFYNTKEWHTYIARSQVLLREGRPVADYIQFNGDNAPGGGANVPLYSPFGYEGDIINGEILSSLTVKDGLITLPFGKTYRFMGIPANTRMNISSVKKIKELVDNGAIIYGYRPAGTYSLTDLNRQDEFQALVKDIFEGSHKGKVYENKSIADVIAAEKLLPDYACADMKGMNLKIAHRADETKDIYYVANVDMNQGATVDLQFRVSGMVPEIWDPLTGNRQAVLKYSEENGMTTVPVHIGRGDAIFVVFTPKGVTSTVAKVSLEDKDIFDELTVNPETGKVRMITDKPGKYLVNYVDGKSKKFNVKKIRENQNLEGSWNVTFETRLLSPVPQTGVQSADGKFTTVKFDALTDWTKHSEEGIRYYSGTAAYQKSFVMKGLSKNERCILKLGKVDVMARVFVNGKEVGMFWKPPFDIDITDFLHKGSNNLVVKITNLWPNRLIGDEQYPDDVTRGQNWKSGELFERPEWVENETERPEKRRVAFTTFKHWKFGDELIPSGLNGPVTLSFPVEIEF